MEFVKCPILIGKRNFKAEQNSFVYESFCLLIYFLFTCISLSSLNCPTIYKEYSKPFLLPVDIHLNISVVWSYQLWHQYARET